MRCNRIGDIAAFDTWSTSTEEQKEKAVAALIGVESRYFGISECKFKVEKLDVGEVVYNSKEDCVYLKDEVYNSTDGYYVLQLLCEGINEKYIRAEINLCKQVYEHLGEYSKLLIFDHILACNDAELGKEEIKKDCQVYAKQSVESYKAAINNYVNKQKSS